MNSTLAASLYYLLHNSHTLKTLEREILSTFTSRSEIRMGPKMQSCTYLRACIDETMRMTPAVGGVLPREVLPGGLTIPSLDLHLPAGIDVGVPIYAIHHHPDYIVSPFLFDPSRWLSNTRPETSDDSSTPPPPPHPQSKEALLAVYNPFSIGHRACLGKPLVYMELMIALARIIWEFEMRLSEEQFASEFVKREIRSGKRQPWEYQLQDWFMSRNEGPWAEFRVRETREAELANAKGGD